MLNQKVLILGSGGREHALALRFANDSQVANVSVCPGNPGMNGEKIKIVKIDLNDYQNIVKFCQDESIDLVFVGPEEYLCNGLCDVLRTHHISVIGPNKEPAKLEGSKIFAKEIMQKFNLPTAEFVKAQSFNESLEALVKFNHQEVVVKADGLAGGKGVVVTFSKDEARDVLDAFFNDDNHSVKTNAVVIEERLVGREVSGFFLCDGESYKSLGYICDHKRAHDRDMGPNTGGMGCISPTDFPSEDIKQRVESEIVKPLLTGLKNLGIPYNGILFVGLMVNRKGAYIIEFNVRFGDPETQTLLPLLEGDFYQLMKDTADGKLLNSKAKINKRDLFSTHVVMCSEGYPQLEKTKPMNLKNPISINGFSNDENLKITFAGVALNDQGELVNSSGRVLGVSALAKTSEESRAKCYEALKKINFQGAFYRHDIGIAHKRFNVALFASGNGSNVLNLLEKFKDDQRIKFSCLIVDREDAGIIEKAKNKLPIYVIAAQKGMRRTHEREILKVLSKHEVNWVILAGYMRILSQKFLEQFYDESLKANKVINIHPSMLPHFPGKTAYEDAYAANVRTSGVTIHFVDSGIDTGPILLQQEFPRVEGFENFKAKGMALEYELYPKAILNLLDQHVGRI
jgi:phosphoribosylamine--glycine ligase